MKKEYTAPKLEVLELYEEITTDEVVESVEVDPFEGEEA